MKFSIIIPTYNRAAFLPKAIESVIGQTYTDWELIIVDDGSTDATKEVVLSYKDKRIQYIYQDNAERSAARNKGIQHAQGDFVCFMDSDEYIDDNRLCKLYEAIVQSQSLHAAYYTDIRFETEDGSLLEIRKGSSLKYPIDYNELIQMIIGTPQLCIAAPILRKYTFNPSIVIGEDMELLFRIVQKYPIIYLPNSATITEVEHTGRSVANRSASSEKQFKALDLMFKTAGNKLSRKNRRKVVSAALFRAAHNYLLDGDLRGVKYLFQSLFCDIQSPQTKYKINLILCFFYNKRKLKNMLIQ
jgi:glycosyltransferase involved in cell wall biosynthesis